MKRSIEEMENLKQLLEQRNRELEKCRALLRERKAAEEDEEVGQVVEERFRHAFHNTSACMVLVSPEGRFLDANHACCSLLGYAQDELLQLTVEEITSPADREETIRRLSEAAAGSLRTFTLDKRYLRKDGATVWGHTSTTWFYDDAGHAVYSVAVIQDITHRKNMEDALRESEEKFFKAFQSAPIAISISTMAEGRFIEVNEAFEKLFKIPKEEAIGRTSLELGIWGSAADRAGYVQALLKEGRARDFEVRVKAKSGEDIIAVLSGETMELRGERCVLSLLNNITIRKRMEERIEILNTDLASRAMELEVANQDLEAFNYTVSHDLRAPLTGIAGFSKLLQESCDDRLDEDGKRFLREIQEAATRMDELITTMLNFSRISRGELSRGTTDLSFLATTVAAHLMMHDPGRKVSFIVEEGVTVDGDQKLLKVVLENLMGNAWKYTSGQDNAVIEFGAMERGGETVSFVRDNGPGFDIKDAEMLFQVFQRLPGTMRFAGHGIGLATVQRIIQRHGGKVWAEGEPGRGATFYFTVPTAGGEGTPGEPGR